MKQLRLKPLAGLIAAIVLTACASPPTPSTPTGSVKVQANSDEAIRDYTKRSFEYDKLATEKAQLVVYTSALTRQNEELKAYITSQIVDVESNRSKGIQSNPVVGQTPKLDEALTAINSRMASLERIIANIQQIAAKTVNIEDLMLLRKKIADIELKLPADKTSQLSNETFDAKEVIVPSKQSVAVKAAPAPVKIAMPAKAVSGTPAQPFRVERQAGGWEGRNGAAVAAGLEYVEKQNAQANK